MAAEQRREDGGTMLHWLARARIRGNYLVMPHNLTHHRVIEEAKRNITFSKNITT